MTIVSPSPYPEATQDPTGNGPDGTLGTDDDVTIKDLYTVTDSVLGQLTFVRPPLNGGSPEGNRARNWVTLIELVPIDISESSNGKLLVIGV